MAATVDGTRHVLVVARLTAASLDPATGKVRFQFPFGMRGPTVNGASPVVLGNRLFLTSSYGIGATFKEINAASAVPIWEDADLMASQYSTSLAHDGLLFGFHGRQDSLSGSASFRCLEPGRRKLLWEQRGLDYGTAVKVGDDLLLLTCSGELIHIKASPEGWKEIQKSKILNATPSGYRLPAVAGGRLFVRDDSTLKCLSL